MPDISDQLQSEIDRLCAQGDADADRARFSAALGCYWAAWDLLPEPKLECDASTWILAAVGDANFLGGDFVAGRDNLSTVMHCPGAIGIPFLHMRLGQCRFELGDQPGARDELTRAYLVGGAHLFEAEDPKYLGCLPPALFAPAAAARGWHFWKSQR
ncbi:MAG: tetratricopeptide repeat protein [Pseudomonadota bacterium]